MISYISNKLNDYWSSILISILKNGANLPKRIGIIMDGNRRYAKMRNFKEIQGHTDGMETLLNLLKWSIALKIEELTVFAFSIDNFKRTEEEINGLMNLFKENFYKFANNLPFRAGKRRFNMGKIRHNIVKKMIFFLMMRKIIV